MRNVPLVVAIAFALVVTAAAQTQWKPVSSFSYDWDEHSGVQFSLSIPSEWNDPGDFTRIAIRVPEHRDVVFTNPTGWVKYRSKEAGSLDDFPKTKNLIPSDYVLAVKDGSRRTLLLLLGYAYASSPGSLDLLEISESGDVQRVLHKEEFGVAQVRDLDGDGLSEVVGKACFSQEWGNGLLTYDPYSVYKLSETPGEKAELSLTLSKPYNLKHYYGWAGPNCSEDVAVVLHPPKGGKPIVVSAKEAERLTEAKQ